MDKRELEKLSILLEEIEKDREKGKMGVTIDELDRILEDAIRKGMGIYDINT